MRVLLVASFNRGSFAPFILEQAESLRAAGVECEFFGVSGKGVTGYLRALGPLRREIRRFRPDVIHAHYGLCGLLANLQRSVPVVTTYHGSDINDPSVLRFSRVAMRLSARNVFVSARTMGIAGAGGPSRGGWRSRCSLIPCGVNPGSLPPVDRAQARRLLGLDPAGRYVLFAGAFDNEVKNAPLAREAAALLPDVTLLELKGRTREEVNLLMNAADAFLMTSRTEGSPQVVKEAMAAGCPLVSVDVGDVAELTEGLGGCFVTDRTPEALAAALSRALAFPGRTEGRSRLAERGLTNELVAARLKEIYGWISH